MQQIGFVFLIVVVVVVTLFYEWLAYMYIYHVHAVPSETRRGHQSPWNWNYR